MRHALPSLFPFVLLKLNGRRFKNTVLLEATLKLSLRVSVLLLRPSDKYQGVLPAEELEGGGGFRE